MLEFLVGLMLSAFWASFVLTLVVLPVLRISIIMMEHMHWTKALGVVLFPASFGFFLVPGHDRLKKVYRFLVLIAAILMVIGAVMIYYTRYQ